MSIKRIALVLLLCSLCPYAKAQTADESMVNFQTPNVAGFGLYTQVPVSQFTGTPRIDIPIYEIVEGKFKIPIALNYHPSSVRVHSHPGWVGLGWTLTVGGSITRTANGQLDEFKGKAFLNNQELGYYGTYSKLAGTEAQWTSTSRMQQYALDYIPFTTTPRLEGMPDEFSFSFLGYSGKFFLTHEGQWKVISDQDIKVEFNPTIGEGFILESGLRQYFVDRLNSINSPLEDVWSNRYFNKFTLITPDGARYEFGGVNATEYSMPYVQQHRSGVVPVTWHLSKITTPNGAVITFNYEPGNIILAATTRFYYRSTNRNVHQTMFNLEVDCSGNIAENIQESQSDGTIMFPVYLTSINYPRGSVMFDRSVTTELRWPTDQMIDNDMHPNSSSVRGFPLYFEPLSTPPNNYTGFGVQRKWYKLDKIRIYDYAYPTYPLIKMYNFTYTSSDQERLKLLSLQPDTFTGVKSPPYVFTYHPLKMPSYSQIRSNDHWDFYNGFDPANFMTGGGSVAVRAQKFYTAREADVNGVYMKAEVLEQIQYPTGGRAVFDYEPHTFSKVVDRGVNTFPVNDVGKNKVAGGLRIRKILHFSANADVQPSLIKEYFYVRDFTMTGDMSAMKSSGILGGYPKYYWPNYTAKDIGGATFTYSVFSSGSILPFGYNAAGSHIGYSEVTEVSKKSDGTTTGYIKYKFSNFDTDIWGETHPDEIGYSLDPSRSIFSPFTSNENQRGKLLEEGAYNTADQLVKATKYKYTMASNGHIRRLFQEPFDVCASTTASAQVCFVTAFKTYVNRYNLTRKEVIEYDGTNSFTTTTNFEYNAQNLMSRTTQSTSDNSTIETTIRYPLDFTTNAAITQLDAEAISISKLVQRNIINLPIEKVTKRNGLVTNASLTAYKIFGNNVFAHKRWDLESLTSLASGVTIGKTVGLETDKFNPAGLYLDAGNYYFRKDEHYSPVPMVFDQYDDYGNVREIYKLGDLVKCYLMSYKNGLPVAEIVGATYAQVAAAGVDINSLASGAMADASVRGYIAQLRSNLPAAQITGYTYSPFGITSKTDPNGKITFYEYDALGRLVVIRDHDGKVIEAYKYHFTGEN